MDKRPIAILDEYALSLGFYFSEVLNTPLVRPYWIYISLTHKCNFRCQMCGVKKILKEYELDFKILKKALDEVAGWNLDCVVMLTGGEPFLRKDILDIINYSVSLGLKTEIVSNGSLIDNPQLARRIIESGLKNIAISLDGVSADTHDYIRGTEGGCRKALDALGYLCEAKKAKGSGPQISVWTTIMKENIGELYDIIFLVKELGVECLVYHPVIVTQEDMQNTIKSGQFWVAGNQIKMLRQQIDKIVDYQKKNGLIAFLHDPYLWLNYFEGTLAKKHWKCNPFVFIDIGPDGNVRSCGPAFGNVKEMSLIDCLNTPAAKKARERMMLCEKPCLQTCWGMPESDSLIGIINNFIAQLDGSGESEENKKSLLEQALHSLYLYEDLLTHK